MLTTGTFTLALFSAVAGMLGENLVLPDSITQASSSGLFSPFAFVNLGVLLVCVVTFWAIVNVLVRRKLI
jgi:hypothetical protein